MSKKNYFLTIDTETTQPNKQKGFPALVADFGATVSDSKGNIVTRIAVLVDGIFTDFENHPLFFTSDKSGIWSKKGQDRRYAVYEKKLKNGDRMIASVAAINRWLVQAKLTYDPILTAYNLGFDLDKMDNTGIDVSQFDRRFCLWAAAATRFGKTKKYKNFALSVHAFNAPTPYWNMSYKTNAETMARFCLNNPDLPDEEHMAIEDVVDYELPILNKILKTRSVKWLLTEPLPYNWRNMQVKDHFTSI